METSLRLLVSAVASRTCQDCPATPPSRSAQLQHPVSVYCLLNNVPIVYFIHTNWDFPHSSISAPVAKRHPMTCVVRHRLDDSSTHNSWRAHALWSDLSANPQAASYLQDVSCSRSGRNKTASFPGIREWKSRQTGAQEYIPSRRHWLTDKQLVQNRLMALYRAALTITLRFTHSVLQE